MLKGKFVYVNLIFVNFVEEKGFRRFLKEKIKVFFEILRLY